MHHNFRNIFKDCNDFSIESLIFRCRYIYIRQSLHLYQYSHHHISSNSSTNKKTSEYRTLNMESTNLIDKNILQCQSVQSINLYFSATKNYIFPSKENSNR